MWGGAAFGKLGLNARSSVRKPMRVEGPLVGKVVASVALGTQHSACVTADGELYTWGQGRRLGHEENGEADEPLPRPVQALAGLHVKKVACGEGHTLCLLDSGDIWAWGISRAAGHGDPSSPPNAPTPLRVLRGKGVTHIACGGCRSLALCDAGHVASKASAQEAPKGSLPGTSRGPSTISGKTATQQSRQSQITNTFLAKQGTLSGAVGAASGALQAKSKQPIATADDEGSLSVPKEPLKSEISPATCTEADAESSAEVRIAQLSRELQAARIDSLLLAALLKGAATELDAALHRITQLEAEVNILEKSSADAGERLATLRGHYEQHIKELEHQLAQQDVEFHAALAARSCGAVSSGSQGANGVPPAALAPRLSLEEALADPLGSQGPTLFMLRETGSSPSSERASGTNATFESSQSPSAISRGEKKPHQGLMLRPKDTEPFGLPFSSTTAPSAASVAPRRQQQHPQQGENQGSAEPLEHISDGDAALQGAGNSLAIPIFVLDDNENPWL